MCGFYGVIHWDGAPLARDEVAAMLQRPLVTLFSVGPLVRFRPLDDPARQRVLQAATHRIQDLSLAEVQTAVEDLWQQGVLP